MRVILLTMLVFNTLTGQKTELEAPKGRPLNIFVCGPTVYDHSHIGHARTYLAFDIITRYLRAKKIKVFYLQNITDVDDKIIDRAGKEKTSPLALAKNFEREYYKDMRALGIVSVNKYARATDHIKEIIAQIQTLVKKGHAYKIENDGYYFDISTFPDYGRLSRRTTEQAEDAISRIDESINKRNKGDFALWKFSKTQTGAKSKSYTMKVTAGEPAWATPLGSGRPGWHIEDTAITENYFGPQYDMHGGGIELKFPHHEAEIAQQESASGKKPFVKIWMHTGSLLINGKKMSKSLGNFTTIKEFLKSGGEAETAEDMADVLRMIVILSHYRSPVDYGKGTKDFARGNLRSTKKWLEKLQLDRPISTQNRIGGLIDAAEKEFNDAMGDDFNTPRALSSIFILMNGLRKIGPLNRQEAKIARNFIYKKIKTFGFYMKLPKKPRIPQEIKALVKEREAYRRNKQFIQSDALRKKTEGLGYKIEDTPGGPFVWPS